MTDLALGAKWGRPSGPPVAPPSEGGDGGVARPMPSFHRRADSARPVKPMPVSARKVRRERVAFGAIGDPLRFTFSARVAATLHYPSPYRNKLMMIHQHVDQILPRPQRRIGGR